MLTFFAIPKPFRGHLNVIQRNAVQSWQQLHPECEVILMGDDPGTDEAAKELGVRHAPKVDRNEAGTPLVSSIFSEAQRAASYPILCYINADIILMGDFLQAVRRVLLQKTSFLLVGRRWDIDIREPLRFCNGWEEDLRRLVLERGKLHAHTGIDYFVFPRGLWTEIPPFAIGRGAWDNWLIYRAKSQGTAVIDLTPTVTIAHQNHDYEHLPGGRDAAFKGAETVQNFVLAGGYAHLNNVADANYQLENRGIRRKLTPYYFYRRLVTLSGSHRTTRCLLRVLRSALAAVRGDKDSVVLE